LIYVVNADCLKRKSLHETEMVQCDEIRSFDRFSKNVGTSYSIETDLSISMQSQLLGSNQLIGNEGKDDKIMNLS